MVRRRLAWSAGILPAPTLRRGCRRDGGAPVWRLALVVAGALLLALPGGWTGAQEADFRSALKVISDKFRQRYPHVEGFVVAVRGGEVYLSLGEKDPIHPGLQLHVIRPGDPFRHPITGEVLGRLEKAVGNIEIVRVLPRYSVAKIVRLAPGKELSPRGGDRARLTAAKVKVALLPFENRTKEAVNADLLTRELGREMEATGRFEVFDIDRLQIWMLENAIPVDQLTEGASALKLRNLTRTDLAVRTHITELKGRKVLTAELRSLSLGKTLFEAQTLVLGLPAGASVARTVPLRRGGGGRVSSANPEFVLARQGVPGTAGRVLRFAFDDVEFRSLAIADVDKDGKKELLVLTPEKVFIFRVEEGRLRQVATHKGGGGSNFLWMDVADTDGNGLPEVYIANHSFKYLLSTVLEWRGGRFQLQPLLKDSSYFYRVLWVPRDGKTAPSPLLLGQSQGLKEPFEGPIRRYRWAAGKLSSEGAFELPRELTILGFTLWDVDKDGQLEVIEVGKDDLLRVYSRKGETIWTSSQRYGGFPVSFRHYLDFGTGAERELDDGVQKVPIRGRLLVADSDGDGVEEVLTSFNEPSVRVVPGLGFGGGQVVSLLWDGSGLAELWRSRKLKGVITDFAVGDADGDGKPELVVVSPESRYPQLGFKSSILIYKMRE